MLYYGLTLAVKRIVRLPTRSTVATYIQRPMLSFFIPIELDTSKTAVVSFPGRNGGYGATAEAENEAHCAEGGNMIIVIQRRTDASRTFRQRAVWAMSRPSNVSHAILKNNFTDTESETPAQHEIGNNIQMQAIQKIKFMDKQGYVPWQQVTI